jgi:hypothetical protein
MLQAVNNMHDHGYMRSKSNSVQGLVAARTDGKKHLLLAASGSVATIKSLLTNPPKRPPFSLLPLFARR